MLKVPSAFGYHPSYAGVMLAPRSRLGSSGSGPPLWGCGVWAARRVPPTSAQPAAATHRAVRNFRLFISPDDTCKDICRRDEVRGANLAASAFGLLASAFSSARGRRIESPKPEA